MSSVNVLVSILKFLTFSKREIWGKNYGALLDSDAENGLYYQLYATEGKK